MAEILVIEDDNAVRELLRTVLTRAGHQVREAADGQAGIHSFRTAPADLVITDLIMPRKEGLETIIDLKQEFPDLNIIAISGGDRENREDYLKTAELCGAARIFHKPFEPRDLVAAVAELLDEN